MPEDPQKPKEPDWLEQIKNKVGETALSWGVPGLVVALALHFAREQKWREAIALAVLAGLVALLLRFFDKLSPHLDKFFEWLANNFVGWVQRQWWKLTAQFQGRYYESLIYAYRDFRTQGLKTKGPFTLDLEKVFVPLRVAPESVDRVTAGMLQAQRTSEGLKIWDFLAQLRTQPAFRRIVVIAPPGAGKSTLLEHLALTYAKNSQRRQARSVPRLIPVLLYLRDVRGVISSEQPPDLATLIEQQESIQKLNPQGWFKRKLDRGKCLVMLDGLDEVADEHQRQQVSRWVDRQMQAYPKTPFMLTSRPFGYRSAPLNQVGTILEIKPFSLREMRQFVNNWYLQHEIMSRLGKDDPGVRELAEQQAHDLIKRIQDTPTLAAMALNPLLLTMIATVHHFRGALPGRRVELYDEICDVLLGRRQDAKGMPDFMTAMQKKAVLQVLALGLMEQQTREFTPALGARLIQNRLRDIAGTEADAAQFLKQIENTTGLLAEREQGVYKFAHKSFQEYLAAVELTNSPKAGMLAEKMQDAWWDETIRLYAAQTDATHLIEAALQHPTVTALTLAYDCAEEGFSTRPAVRQALETKLDAGLESADAELFKLAAEVKLARRLKRLIRIDETTEIDNSLITCAEYQLFIDEKRNKGENRHPDHWQGYRFPQGDAAKPIAGIRASDAEEFCQWLTARSATRYRLPTAIEAENHPIQAQDVGYWCGDGDAKAVVGIAPQQWASWSEKVLKTWMLELEHDLGFDFGRRRDRSHDPSFERILVPPLELHQDFTRIRIRVRSSNLTLELIRAIDNDLVQDRDLARALDRVLVHDSNFIRDLNRVRARVIEIYLAPHPAPAHIHDFDLALHRDRNFYLDLARTLERDLARALDLALELLQNRNGWNTSSNQQLRFVLLVFAILWTLLSRTYAEAALRLPRGVWSKPSKRKNYEEKSQEYAQRRHAAISLYGFCVLVERRQAGKMPAWEGIRLVRTRLEG